jgi:putative colanic acid biosynthesis UDP-glucose lipid carrier transferase
MNLNLISAGTHKVTGISLSRDNALSILEALLDPGIAVFTLWVLAFVHEGTIAPSYLVLSLITFMLTFPSDSNITISPIKIILNTLLTWTILTSLLMIFGIASKFIVHYSSSVIVEWLFLTPVLQITASLSLKKATPCIIKLQGATKRAVIVGINNQGIRLALQLENNPYNPMNLIGFFEDRTGRYPARLPGGVATNLLGKLDELAAFVRSNQVNVIYISLPMTNQSRILKLLDDLKDTTASIYFVPDMFLTDLIQSRVDQVGDMPVVATCETPFTGGNGLLKRAADIAFASGILIVASPVLLIISAAIKLTSPGPIIFKQYRYGLDGEEILVYKFRTMSVTENGPNVTQAKKNDPRITKIGNFLRKSSLDELPQFFNVLQGRMSVVGPRPHAVAHNEMYRKLIKGYMIRHKVKPGITGWAQVNGLRGETDTLDKMQARIDYDIEYLRNWSPLLDTYIILRTIWVAFFKGQKSAY